MKEKEKEEGLLPQPSFADLRGRQSVRATFKLSEKAIRAISILSEQLGIKQKSLFDHLMEDMETLHLIAEDLQTNKTLSPDRVQKTYVISRRSLSCLERVSKDFETSRDALIESSIKRLLPLIAQEREKHQKRKEILEDVKEYLKRGGTLLKKAGENLGDEDPVYESLELAVLSLNNSYLQIQSFVEKGKKIENF
jgi:hypothetical protein